MSTEIQKNTTELELLDELETSYFKCSVEAIRIVKKIYDKKLYKLRGYKSFAEYAEERLNISKSIAYVYLKTAQKNFPTGGKSEAEYVDLGVKKMDALNKLDDNLFQEIMGGKRVDFNGKMLDFEDIKEMAAKEVKGEVIKLKKELAAEQKKRKIVQSEIESYDQKIAAANALYQKALDTERMFGARASTYEAKHKCQDLVRKLAGALEQAFFQTNIDKDDPLSMKQNQADLIRKIHQIHGRALDNYGFLADDIGDA